MNLTEKRHIAAEPAQVWAALFDTAVLQRSIPGCESVSGTPAEGYDMVVVQGIGPVKARFAGRIVLSRMVPGVRLRIDSEGQGGVAGFAKGGADVALQRAEGGTLLTYHLDAAVGGRIGQMGGRIIDGFAKALAAQFFDRFKAEVEGTAPPRRTWVARLLG